MTSQESMISVINWELPQEAFRHEIRSIIREAHKSGKVIGLPLEATPGQPFLDAMTLLLAQVNCDNCDAPCCRSNPQGIQTGILPPEYKRLSEKYGKENFIVKGDEAYLPMPCPFLKANRCTIYRDRPLVCVLYPFQPGAFNGEDKPVIALASSCPEGRRIALRVFMTSWRIRQQFYFLGEKNFMRGLL